LSLRDLAIPHVKESAIPPKKTSSITAHAITVEEMFGVQATSQNARKQDAIAVLVYVKNGRRRKRLILTAEDNISFCYNIVLQAPILQFSRCIDSSITIGKGGKDRNGGVAFQTPICILAQWIEHLAPPICAGAVNALWKWC
jgi:hypothetical protein